MYSYATDFNTIKFVIDDNQYFQIVSIKIYNGNDELSIEDYTISNRTMEIFLQNELNIKNQCYILYENKTIPVNYFTLYQSDNFNKRFYFSGDLGLNYSKTSSEFKVWSPVAKEINLLVYENGDPDIEETPRRFKMTELNGVFSVTISEDLKGLFYVYEVNVFYRKNIAIDPYAKAVGINGLRGAIIDMEETNPENWDKDLLFDIKSYTDAIIYETSIRDISIHVNSGAFHKGKFLGLSEETGKPLNHIKDLGITHLQLMPFFDFSYTSIDEKNPVSYNWGYDPQNYNAPEGSYSTDPDIPTCRIIELKKMIFALHKNKICINMDVVYNHVYNERENSFEKIFPGYYLRRNLTDDMCNGSGCGNDTASEQTMMRKFILDSILFWAKEYHIDGFRFDLMGLHDIDTMNLIKDKLDSLGRNIMLYGEGWDLNTNIPGFSKAMKSNANKTPKIGYFNDYMRDIIKGHVFELKSKGFVNGGCYLENALKYTITGTKSPLISPEQSINYASCHDNSTLWDKLQDSNGEDSIEDRIKMVKLANAIILTSQGVPFLHSGEEFLRTKFGEHNSFKSPDKINYLDWDRKDENQATVNYIMGLINIRRFHPAFRMNNYLDIEKNLEFIEGTYEGVIAYIIKNHANGDNWKEILIIFNANKNPIWMNIPRKQWYLALDHIHSGVTPIKLIDTPRICIEGISAYIAFTQE